MNKFNPIVVFIYFVLVIGFSMFLMHPICLAISFFCAFLYSIILLKEKALKFNLTLLPLAIIAVLINGLFNHEGTTIITYFYGKAITLESISYGFASSTMILSVIYWFNIFNHIITTDKILYIFGKVSPKLSLLLSMVFRFVPKFSNGVKEISNAQKGIGKDIDSGSVLNRIKNGISILSSEVSTAFDDGIETSQSMKSRGYIEKGRTSFEIYSIKSRDIVFLIMSIIISLYIIMGIIKGKLYYRYFPTIEVKNNLSYILSYLALCGMAIVYKK